MSDQNVPDTRHGHPKFYALCDRMASLHDRKNRDYAFGGPPTGNFNRVAQAMRMYPSMEWSTPEGVAMIYMLKQLDAYLWLKNSGHQSVTGEGFQERLLDIAIYTGIISCIEGDKSDGAIAQCTETQSNQLDVVHDRRPDEPAVPGVPGKREGERHTPTADGSRGLYFTKRTPAFSGGEDPRP